MFAQLREKEESPCSDLECTPTGGDELWLINALFFNEFGQTDRVWTIASLNAVLNAPIHVKTPFSWPNR